jgi:hypothetical protein
VLFIRTPSFADISQMMAREITHASCLLERPKSQRRTLSILTDKQHAQISQALNGIAEVGYLLLLNRAILSFNSWSLGTSVQLSASSISLWNASHSCNPEMRHHFGILFGYCGTTHRSLYRIQIHCLSVE